MNAHDFHTLTKKLDIYADKKSVLQYITSVPDPDPKTDPDPPDPHVFGPPGSESRFTSQMYVSESGSGSFYHQGKIVRKTLIPTVL